MLQSTINNDLYSKFVKRGDKASADRHDPLLSETSMPAPESIISLSRNPRSNKEFISFEQAIWLYRTLKLSNDPSFDALLAKGRALKVALKELHLHDSAILSSEGLVQAQDKINFAIAFLRWPQNRERVAILFENSPELRMNVKLAIDSSPSILPLNEKDPILPSSSLSQAKNSSKT